MAVLAELVVVAKHGQTQAGELAMQLRLDGLGSGLGSGSGSR